MSKLNSLRQAIGISSTGFELSQADYLELLIFSATRDYGEFQQACDNVNAKYPTLTKFLDLLKQVEENDAEFAKSVAADKNKIRMYSRESCHLVDGVRVARAPTKAEVLAYFSHPSSMLAEFDRWKSELSNQRRRARYTFTAEDLRVIDAEHLDIFALPKSSSERVAELRDRREAEGIKQLNIYAHADDHDAIKTYAAKLAAKRSMSSTS